MQYVILKNFIFWHIELFLGGMHKVAVERQVFFCQNHALPFWKKLHKILI